MILTQFVNGQDILKREDDNNRTLVNADLFIGNLTLNENGTIQDHLRETSEEETERKEEDDGKEAEELIEEQVDSEIVLGYLLPHVRHCTTTGNDALAKLLNSLPRGGTHLEHVCGVDHNA